MRNEPDWPIGVIRFVEAHNIPSTICLFRKWNFNNSCFYNLWIWSCNINNRDMMVLLLYSTVNRERTSFLRAELVFASTESLVFPSPAPLTQVTLKVYVVNDLRPVSSNSVTGPSVFTGLLSGSLGM